jgi:hypothetical protein
MHFPDAYVNSKFETHTSSFRERNSRLSGKLLLETVDEQVMEISANKKVLASADIGDWLLIGCSDIESIQGKKEFDDFYYNIKKALLLSNKPLEGYGGISGKAISIMSLLFITCVIASFNFEQLIEYTSKLFSNISASQHEAFSEGFEYLPMAFYTAIMAGVLLLSSINGIRNKLAKKQAVKPINEKLAESVKQRQGLLDVIEKLK